MPWLSSSAPGPSPTKTRRAFGFPTPKTRFFLPEQSLQRLQSPSVRRTSSRRGGSVEPPATAGSAAGTGAGRGALDAGTEPAAAPTGTSTAAHDGDVAGMGREVTSAEPSRYSTTTGGLMDPSTVTSTDVAAAIAPSALSLEAWISSPTTSRCQPR